MDEGVLVFRLTLSQVNDMIACMGGGPYGKVTAIINELSQQIREQSGQPNGDSKHVESVLEVR